MTRLRINRSPGSSKRHSHDSQTPSWALCRMVTLTQVEDADYTEHAERRHTDPGLVGTRRLTSPVPETSSLPHPPVRGRPCTL